MQLAIITKAKKNQRKEGVLFPPPRKAPAQDRRRLPRHLQGPLKRWLGRREVFDISEACLFFLKGWNNTCATICSYPGRRSSFEKSIKHLTLSCKIEENVENRLCKLRVNASVKDFATSMYVLLTPGSIWAHTSCSSSKNEGTYRGGARTTPVTTACPEDRRE